MNGFAAPWLLPAITATAQIGSFVAVFAIAIYLLRVSLWEKLEYHRAQRRHLKKLRARVHPSGQTTQNVTLIPRVFDWARDEAL